ncbi:MAG TPA: tetratricopeptide repeat protein [Nitrospirae bacterium]|nr:tetratricopeptide repeat protein [bacterium BMS3Abin06]HDH12621.1 tetratricopeptide repeat protein [Nitrospirota bacterium]HDZ00106.1 tetratricopeptide repeat protein [Nitrospirota bacterium]
METNEAVQSLKLAKSYLKDVDYELMEDARDSINAQLDSTTTNRRKSTFHEALNNVNLAIKQINNAEQIDSTAHLNGNGISYFRSLSLGYRALIEGSLGNRSVSLKYLKKSIELSDNIFITQFAIGCDYQRKGKKEDALRHFKRAIELKPDDMELRKMVDRYENKL